MNANTRELVLRAGKGFIVGIVVCLMYWFSGLVPREIWFGSIAGAELIQAKGWIWPGAILDAVFAHVEPWLAAVTLYVLNGLTYAAIGLALFVVRASAIAYCAMSIAVLIVLGWFNTSVLQTFSWLGLFLVVAGLLLTGVRDFRAAEANREVPKI